MRKTDFQDGSHGGNLGFLIEKILAIFDLQLTPLLPTKLQVNWPSVQKKEKGQTDFQDGGHGFPDASYQVSSQLAFWFRRSDKKIFKMVAMAAIEPFKLLLIYRSPQCFLPCFESIGLLVSRGGEKKNRFSRWQPSCISDRNNFSYF